MRVIDANRALIAKTMAHIRAKNLDSETMLLFRDWISLSVEMALAIAVASGEITIKKGEVDHG